MKSIFGFLSFALLFTFLIGTPRAQSVRTEYFSGHFEGTALNTTANQRGKVTFDLYAFDPSTRQIRAYFSATQGLSGEAWLIGTVTSQGELSLHGRLSDFSMAIHGRLNTDGTIEANYQLEGAQNQKGSFEVRYQQSLPTVESTTRNGGQDARLGADLVGAWEVGGGLPAQINPISGEATGISFVEARRLEIFPDGSFKHVQSHRHCEGTGSGRCCREQAMLEQGHLAILGQRMLFDVKSGGTIVKDGCNPRLSQQGDVAHRQVMLAWSLSRNSSGNPQLCLQSGSEAPLCYNRSY